jgi:hypothetical protein
MRLSTPGAVLLAGVLVLAGFLFHAAFPRYEMKTLGDGTLVRVDRWTASSESPNSNDLPEWAAIVARTPWPARVSRVTIFEGTVLLAAGGGIASWRARRAWRIARVRRRLHAMVASDSGWLQRV